MKIFLSLILTVLLSGLSVADTTYTERSEKLGQAWAEAFTALVASAEKWSVKIVRGETEQVFSNVTAVRNDGVIIMIEYQSGTSSKPQRAAVLADDIVALLSEATP